MHLVLNTAPAARPVTTSDVKAHLRIDHSDQDTYLDELVDAATNYVESHQNRSLITTTWDLYLDCWPAGREILLPRAPLQSVTSIVHVDDDGAETTLSASSYFVDTFSTPGRVVLVDGAQWPTGDLRAVGGVRVSFVAGHGDASTDVPARQRHLVKLLVAHWYDNVEPEVVGSISSSLPMALESLLAHDRLVLHV